MNKNITIGALIAVVAVFAVVAFKNPAVISVPRDITIDTSGFGTALKGIGQQQAPVVNVPAPIVNVAAPKVTVNVPEQTVAQNTRLGAVSGPDFYGPYWGVNGVRVYPATREWDRNTFGVLGTTTPCSFLSPTSTSTLQFFDLNITLSTSTAGTWTLATSTTAYATTTALYQYTNVAGKEFSWSYVATSTSPTGSLGFGTIPPSTYVNLGVSGVASVEDQPYGFRTGGKCQVQFRVL